MITLNAIWHDCEPTKYKVHFARWNTTDHPLEVLARSQSEWQRWQEYWPGKNDFNRQFIFSLADWHGEPETWLFGGIYEVLELKNDKYEVRLTDQLKSHIGRLKISYAHKNRTTRSKLENYFHLMSVKEILAERYTGRTFPGYANIQLSFQELESIIATDKPDWKVALENIHAVYLITDTKSKRSYVGSAYGDEGLWSRWRTYIRTGHGGNSSLRAFVKEYGMDYCRANFEFTLLEHLLDNAPKSDAIDRETHWKNILHSRSPFGFNQN